MGAILTLVPMYNTKGKRDATRAFIPEAHRFGDYWLSQGADVYEAQIDNRAPNHVRRRQLIEAVRSMPRWRHIAIFAHGWRTGIQFGFRRSHLAALARHMGETAADDSPVVTLYCCSTAQGSTGGDGGFADELRDALCEVGLDHCTVDAHTTRGHTTRNPNLRRFEGEGSAHGGQGGRYIVRPRSRLWGAWRRTLRDADDSLRYRFSRMSIAEIHDRLALVG